LILHAREDGFSAILLKTTFDLRYVLKSKQVRRVPEPSDLEFVLEPWWRNIASFIESHKNWCCILLSRTLHLDRRQAEK
jgi:hypothetical protein